MVSEKKKRESPNHQLNQQSNKRQRIESQKQERKKAVLVDALPWTEAELPDMFDDAEGFYGLEEADGVEVVKEGGAVKFLSSVAQTDDQESDEFEGFSDEDLEASNNEDVQDENAEQAKPVKEKKPKEKLKSEKKKKKEPASSTETKGNQESLQANIFEALEQEAAEDELDLSAWVELGLSQSILSALAKQGFSKPTPIQSATIPEILLGHDVVGKASTGSGKTLAFGIPIVESWLALYGELADEELQKPRPPTTLILSPTRELAHQLTDHTKKLCAGLPSAPYIVAVTGGLSVQKQQRQLAKADIIIGTPGRLWEVISGNIELQHSLKHIKFLVIDEADRLLTEGHFKEAEDILIALDRQDGLSEGEEDEDVKLSPRQTLVFSATFHKGLQQKLTGKGKRGLTDESESLEYLLRKLNFREDKPKFVDVNPISQMAEGLKEGVIECAGTEKDLYLYAVLLHHPNQRTLIFTNSIHSVRRLIPMLQNLNLETHSLHSHMAQKARMRSIERFSSPSSRGSILVATDVAARGLDIGGVQLVIHYHLPRTADMYVHRSGRTARASSSGTSILLCAPEEVVGVRRLVAKVHAQNAAASGDSQSRYYIRSLDMDRRIVARLKPRVTLAKKIADSGLAKEKKGHDDDWVRAAAEELGVDYDSEEFEAAGGGKKGRGSGRKLKEKESRSLSKAEVGALRAELKSLLAERINAGVSERYLTSGILDVNELLKGAQGIFLGKVDGIGMDDI